MVYLPTFTIFYHEKQPNVGKYTIHGSSGNANANIGVIAPPQQEKTSHPPPDRGFDRYTIPYSFEVKKIHFFTNKDEKKSQPSRLNTTGWLVRKIHSVKILKKVRK